MSALADYYSAMANDRNAAVGLAQAQTRSVNAATSELPANDEADRQAKSASSYLATEQGKTLGPQAASEIAGRDASTATTGITNAFLPKLTSADLAQKVASTMQTGISNDQQASLLQAYGRGLQPAVSSLFPGNALGSGFGIPPGGREKGGKVYANEGGKNPKNGSPGKTDTVPMMMAPGESVLNAGATEHLGGGVIDHLNKLGLMRMAAKAELKDHVKSVKGHSLSSMSPAKKAAGGGRSK